MIKKQIQTYVKLQIPAGSANPSPPIGPALGQRGVNIMEFCKTFNMQTKNIEVGLPIPVIITVYIDRSFSFVLKTPPTAILLKKSIGIDFGSKKPKSIQIGKISRTQIYEIAKIKEPDMTGSNIQSMINSIIGTAHSMGIEVEDF